MARPRTPAAPDPRSPVRNTAGELAEFRRRHPAWAARFTGDEPVYSIPLPAVECLSRPARAGGPPLFDAATAEAERAFTRLCEVSHVVGVQTDGPISFPFLSTGRADLGAGAGAFNWSSTQINTVRELLAAGDEARRRLRGVIGWLLTEPMFRTQVAEIRRLYQAVPSEARPRFPLGRLLLAPDADGGEPFRAFADGLVRLLDRWGLMNLASWDLPNLQGPLLPNLLPEGSPAHGVWVYVPVHYPLRGDDAIQQQIVGFQRSQVAALGIDPSFAGNSHHETYERMFRVIHLERSVRSRFGHPPRGLVGLIEAAAEAALHLSADRVQRLRKLIARCRTAGGETSRNSASGIDHPKEGARRSRITTRQRHTFFGQHRVRQNVGTGAAMPSRKLNLTEDEIARLFTGAAAEHFPSILSPEQLAELPGLSVKTIYEWMSKGRLDGAYRRRGKHALIVRDRALEIIFNGNEWNT